MYHDDIFENSLREVKEESYNSLKKEISSVERAIEKFLNDIFECTTAAAARDFNTMSVF